MEEKNIDQTNKPQHEEPEILVNDYGSTRDSAVVVDDPGCTVMLTEDEPIIIEKQPTYSISPKDRPRKVYMGMWGQAEIATVGLAGLAVLAVILIYIFLVIPSRRELDNARADRDQQEKELISSRSKYGSITSTETQVAKLISSVDDFETRYLPLESTGKTALYQRLNNLIAGYGLVNTSGPEFAPLETADQNQNTEGSKTDERGRAKFQSLYPGVYVTVTLEGPYQNLRRFIREIETGNDFVVVSSVELEPSDSEQKHDTQSNPQAPPASGPAVNPAANPNGFPGFSGSVNPTSGFQQAPAQQRATGPKGKTHGETVSLRIEMAAYFRRPNAVPLNAPAPTAQ